jgi:hypothetical protein
MKFIIQTESSDPNNPVKYYFTKSDTADSCWTKDHKLATVFDDYISAELTRNDLFEGDIIYSSHSVFDVISRWLSTLYVCFILIPFLILLRLVICAFEILANFTLYNFTRITLPDEILSKISTGTMSYGFLKIIFAITVPLTSCFYETRDSIRQIKF